MAHESAKIAPRDMERHFEKVERRISVAYQDPESIGRDADRTITRDLRSYRASVEG